MLALDGDGDFLEQRAQQLLPVTHREICCVPQLFEVFAKYQQALALFRAQRTWSTLFVPGKFCLGLFEFTQLCLPLCFKSARDQTVLRIHGAVASFGTQRFVVRPFDSQAPLRKRCIVIGLKTFCGLYGRFEAGWFNGVQEGLRNGGVNLQATNIEALDATTILDIFVRTMVTRRLIRAAVVGFKRPTAVATGWNQSA